MSTIIENATPTPTNVGNLPVLIASTLIPFVVVLALALHLESTPKKQVTSATVASVTHTSPRPLADEDFVLYLVPTAHDAQLLRASQENGRKHWYAYPTPDEETYLWKMWDHANSIRYDLGLPAIEIVDLRGLAASSGGAAQHIDSK